MKKSFLKFGTSIAAVGLIVATISTSVSNVFAATSEPEISSESKKTDNADNLDQSSGNDTVTINGITMTKEEFNNKLDEATVTYFTNEDTTNNSDKLGLSNMFAPAIAGVAFIPGIGEALITATGAVVIGGVIVKGVQYFESHRSNVQPKNHDKHTKPRPGRGSEKKKQKKGWKSRK